MLLDAVAIWLAYSLLANGSGLVAALVLLIAGGINLVFLVASLAPIRWLVPGLALMVLFVVYPLVNTLTVAVTNYGNIHLLSKEQAIAQFEGQFYSAPEAPTYVWHAYRAPDGRFLLWLTDQGGRDFIGDPGAGVTPVRADDPGIGPRGTDGLPDRIGDYDRLSRLEVFPYLSELQNLRIRTDAGVVRIVSLDAAPLSLQKYGYDAARDVLVDRETGVEYRNVEGIFTGPNGAELSPGFSAFVGARNFVRAFTDPDVRGPFLSVFLWTVAFAALSVLLTFGAGLGLALVLNDRRLPAVGLLRALTIVPYAVPGFISALIWVGLMNPFFGQFNKLLESAIGLSPQWFSDPTLAKVAILLVNLWLGYPYMLLIALGALQSISAELFEAAQIDGAAGLQRFRFITLPLLLVALGPLLIGSFAFNFNNFTIIELVTGGGPPIPGTAQPAGATDILISYTYRVAFAGGRGVEYGFAAALSVYIFLLTAGITALNFRMTRQLEQVSENL